MAQPAPYNRLFNFSAFQAENPTVPLPAVQVDGELARIKAVTDQIRVALQTIQRDDLALANKSVGFDQLKAEVSIGVNQPSQWATLRNYIVRDPVFYQNKFYAAQISHISGVFATDLAAGKWSLLADFSQVTDAALISYNNATSGIAATNLQDAVDDIASSINVSSVFGRSGAVVATTGDYNATKITFAPAGLVNTSATNTQTAIANIDAALATAQGRVVPSGAIMDFAGAAAPAGWLLCYGQAVSRLTYAALFSAIGTAHGTGDGSTTFNLPDYRGRVAAGKDDMGGSSANRLTNQSGGLDGDVLGATGGAETHTLSLTQVPSHTHSGTTSSNGAHTHDGFSAFQGVGSAGPGGGSTNFLAVTTSSAGAHTHTMTTDSKGGDGAHNNVQPTLILNKIIKT